MMTTARIVIAVENPSARSALRLKLEAFGHQVLAEVGDAETLWRMTRRVRPDAVILETSLEGGAAFEAAEAIRAAFQASIFFLCNSQDGEELERAIAVGCDGFLIQPFTDVALQIGLSMALDRRRKQVSLCRELEELKVNLETRKLVERAKAILMARHKLSEAEAFRRIQVRSMKTATPVRRLAEAIIYSARALEQERR